MSIKEKIILDLNEIASPKLLNQIAEFIELVKTSYANNQESNKELIWQLVGCLSDEDAQEINQIIKEEFNNIEGDWE